MPLYFFETYDGDFTHNDTEGLELSSRKEARREALAAMLDMARDNIPDNDSRILRSTVRNIVGNIVYETTMTISGGWRKADSSKPALILVKDRS